MGELVPYLVVCSVALTVAVTTLFSGFGLGTLLLPAFAFFFPLEVAVAATAVVHLANNLFKLAIVGRWADRRVVLRFGAASAAGALAGAWALSLMSSSHALVEYSISGHPCRVTVTGLVVGGLVVIFGALEFSERLERVSIPPSLMIAGGILSGFFGGLSGHQGALRSAFLLRSGMSKEAMVGTRAVCAVIVDLARLAVYGVALSRDHWNALATHGGSGLVAGAVLAALVGSLLGARLVRAATADFVRRFVGIALLVVGAAIAAGVI